MKNNIKTESKSLYPSPTTEIAKPELFETNSI